MRARRLRSSTTILCRATFRSTVVKHGERPIRLPRDLEPPGVGRRTFVVDGEAEVDMMTIERLHLEPV